VIERDFCQPVIPVMSHPGFLCFQRHITVNEVVVIQGTEHRNNYAMKDLP